LVATMTEEAKKPGRDMPLGLISSMLLITVVYRAMPLVLVGMQRYSNIDANAATRPTRLRFLASEMKWARTCSWAS